MPGQLIGLQQTQARVNRQIRSAGTAAKRELIEFCLAVMGLAARNAPVDLGDLRGGFVIEVNGVRWAHTVSGPDGAVQVVVESDAAPGDGDDIKVYIGTSGIPYAAWQHEKLELQHPKGGQAKFLENALNELLPMLTRRLAEAAKKGAQDAR